MPTSGSVRWDVFLQGKVHPVFPPTRQLLSTYISLSLLPLTAGGFIRVVTQDEVPSNTPLPTSNYAVNSITKEVVYFLFYPLDNSTSHLHPIPKDRRPQPPPLKVRGGKKKQDGL